MAYCHCVVSFLLLVSLFLYLLFSSFPFFVSLFFYLFLMIPLNIGMTLSVIIAFPFHQWSQTDCPFCASFSSNSMPLSGCSALRGVNLNRKKYFNIVLSSMLNQIVPVGSCKGWINKISGGDRSKKIETLFVRTTQLVSTVEQYSHVFELSIGKNRLYSP